MTMHGCAEDDRHKTATQDFELRMSECLIQCCNHSGIEFTQITIKVKGKGVSSFKFQVSRRIQNSEFRIQVAKSEFR